MRSYIQNLINKRYLTENKGLFLLEVGSGEGHDATAFKSLGYKVEEFDKKGGVDLRDFEYKENTYDFINVNNVFPFIQKKDEVKEVLLKMAKALKEGGILNFSLFGNQDEWHGNPHMSFWTFEEAIKLIDSLPVKCVIKSSEEYFGSTMSGETKYWHMLRFLCKKA